MLISLAEYAQIHGKHPDNIRQKVLRGGFSSARKIGRNWVIDSEEPFVDERIKHQQIQPDQTTDSQHIR